MSATPEPKTAEDAAKAEAELAGSPSAERRVELLFELTGYYGEQGQLVKAAECSTKQLEALEEVHGTNARVEYVDCLTDLAFIQLQVDGPHIALETLQRAYSIEDEMGVKVHTCLLALCQVTLMTGDMEGAYNLATQAKEEVEAEHGPDHEKMGEVLLSLGPLSFKMGKGVEEAAVMLERSRVIMETTKGLEAPELVNVYNAQRGLQQAAGDLEGTVATSRRLAVLTEKLHHPSHPKVAQSYQVLGMMAWRAGKLDEAVEALQKFKDIMSAVPGMNPMMLGQVDQLLAQISAGTPFPEQMMGGHGHSHGGQPCHGHGQGGHGHSHEGHGHGGHGHGGHGHGGHGHGGHGHSHGGQPCHGHGTAVEEPKEDAAPKEAPPPTMSMGR